MAEEKEKNKAKKEAPEQVMDIEESIKKGFTFNHKLEFFIWLKYRYVEFVLVDGSTLEAKVLSMDQFNIYIETEKGLILLPKHSIKYTYIKKYEDDTTNKEEEK
jgi:sRNA-binding regulator protein Hfq